MHVILASAGTDGDVFPYIGLGTLLRSRGHHITLVANEHYQSQAAELGFSFRALFTDEETEQVLANPDIWHPIKSALVGAQWGVRHIGRQYELLRELASDDDTVLVASPAVLAARLIQEKFSKPMASLVLQPWIIPSVIAPPVMPGGLTLPRWAPGPLGKLYWRTVDAVGDFLISRHLNPIRTSLGLKRVRRFFGWWLSPELVIGMFPDWYGPPQADWPPQLRLAGFPMFDGRPGSGVPADLLEFCNAGEPAVAFTFGTGMMHASRFFHEATKACRILGIRGIFLTKHSHQLPDPLPSFIRHCEFAPFQQLFPQCAAVVHHGGVGTTAKALAAGVPQLIVPLAFDQPDNAYRLKQLGVGDWVKPNRANSARLAKILKKLMTDRTQTQCREVAGFFGNDTALEVAAQWVEDLSPHF
ncbi:MAG: glycosyltransferase [Planctomycetes bacterium]|nr:glycosyltransferase [Planctomycetota bacterium]